MSLPKLLVFASGESEPGHGGSGFKNLVEHARAGTLRAEIVGVVSNHIRGGVHDKADALDIPFFHFEPPFSPERYREFVQATGADFVACSGWLKFVRGLDSRRTFNIHPGPLPQYGGKGMFGRHVHEAVLRDYQQFRRSASAVTMHFVTEDGYDLGPTFFTMPVQIRPGDTVDTLQKRVNECEHVWQPIMTDKVVSGEITWDGIHPASLVGAELNEEPVEA